MAITMTCWTRWAVKKDSDIDTTGTSSCLNATVSELFGVSSMDLPSKLYSSYINLSKKEAMKKVMKAME